MHSTANSQDTNATYHRDALAKVCERARSENRRMSTEVRVDIQLNNNELFISDAFIGGKWVSKTKKFDVFGMCSVKAFRTWS